MVPMMHRFAGCVSPVGQRDLDEDLLQRLAADRRDGGGLGRIPDRDEHVRPLVRRPTQDLGQEAHGTRRVGQRRQAGVRQRGEQDADRDAHRLAHVVVLHLPRSPVLAAEAVGLLEDHDQPRRIGQVRLAPVGAERTYGIQPLGRHAVLVALAFLRLGRFADARAKVRRVPDEDERPWLLVGATRGQRGSADGVNHELARHRRRYELANRTPPPHHLQEPRRGLDALSLGHVDRRIGESGEGHGGHGSGQCRGHWCDADSALHGRVTGTVERVNPV